MAGAFDPIAFDVGSFDAVHAWPGAFDSESFDSGAFYTGVAVAGDRYKFVDLSAEYMMRELSAQYSMQENNG